jgi:hypothetical protein
MLAPCPPDTRNGAEELCPVVKDPHVEVLYYEFTSLDEGHDFSQAAAWQGNLDGFDCHLANGQLEARPQAHYANAQSARDVLDPHLRAWVLWSELKNQVRIEFKAGGARVVDRTSGSVAVEAQAALVGVIAFDATGVVGHSSYPAPSPTLLAASTLVGELLGWVRDLRERRHPMLFIAYLFLSRLEWEYDGRDQAAKALNVSQRIFNTLGQLSEKNDPEERRKARVRRPVERLTEAERQWILAVLPRVTVHVAEIAAGSNPPQLTMADPDLPPL